ncbi:MAG: hypothetical protein IT385_04300 [Deltaproteobacteria bacterium]|nr:hypothetical protein [Deltaproteobacteria bacterium]
MDWTALGIATGAAAGLVWAWTWWRERRAPPGEHGVIEAIARAIGLARVAHARPPEWHAYHGDVEVGLRMVGGTWELSYRHRAPIDLSANRQWESGEAWAGLDVQIGDRGFDAAVYIAGDEQRLLVALDPEARDRVRRAVGEGWSATRGTWILELDAEAQDVDGRALHELGLALATSTVTTDDDLLERLMARTRDETDPGVLRRLVEVIGEVGGAARLGRLVLGPARAAVRGLALRRLAAAFPEREETIAGVALLSAATGRLEPELAVALAVALRTVRHADPEGVLLALLASEDVTVRAVVVDSLALVGTPPRAVPVLAPLRDGAGGVIAERAGAAIAAIQARVGDVVGGRLALVEGQAGGELAVIDEPERS